MTVWFRLSIFSAFCGLLSEAALPAATPLTFTLDDSCASSAGIFKPDGSLVRTLWSNVRHPAGSHTFIWDDMDDAGATVPAGTYGVLRNVTTRQHDLVELPAKGPLRVTGITLPAGANLYANGDLRTSSKKSSVQTVSARSLTGFDDAGNPLWGEPVVLATTTGGANYNGSFSGPSGPRFPITSSNLLVSFNSDVKSKGMHLGGVPVGGTGWKWLASPSSDDVDYSKPTGKTGLFATGNGTHYGGNQVHASGRHIIYGYHGEGYRGGQANQFMHFRDDGLFLGQFGEVNRPSIMDARTGVSGNAFSLSLVEVNGELYFWNNDESNHGGVHRWHLAGANRIGELTASGPLGTPLNLGRSKKL